jgi:hypothetical protein
LGRGWERGPESLPFCASISLPLLRSVNLGDSGQRGRVQTWKMAGRMVTARSQGQRASVPMRPAIPRTWLTRMEIVRTSW